MANGTRQRGAVGASRACRRRAVALDSRAHTARAAREIWHRARDAAAGVAATGAVWRSPRDPDLVDRRTTLARQVHFATRKRQKSTASMPTMNAITSG